VHNGHGPQLLPAAAAKQGGTAVRLYSFLFATGGLKAAGRL